MNRSWRRKPTKRRPASAANALPLLLSFVSVDKLCKVQLRQTRQAIKRTAPIGSSLLNFSLRGRVRREEWVDSFGNRTSMRHAERIAIGILIQNDHRHPIVSASSPPNMGPETVQAPGK